MPTFAERRSVHWSRVILLTLALLVCRIRHLIALTPAQLLIPSLILFAGSLVLLIHYIVDQPAYTFAVAITSITLGLAFVLHIWASYRKVFDTIGAWIMRNAVLGLLVDTFIPWIHDWQYESSIVDINLWLDVFFPWRHGFSK